MNSRILVLNASFPNFEFARLGSMAEVGSRHYFGDLAAGQEVVEQDLVSAWKARSPG